MQRRPPATSPPHALRIAPGCGECRRWSPPYNERFGQGSRLSYWPCVNSSSARSLANEFFGIRTTIPLLRELDHLDLARELRPHRDRLSRPAIGYRRTAAIDLTLANN